MTDARPMIAYILTSELMIGGGPLAEFSRCNRDAGEKFAFNNADHA
jgi:hypothetical protein